MLQKPSIFKVPSATGQKGFGGTEACSLYNGSRNFSCSPYGSNCVDMTYSPSCGWGLGITAVGSVAAVVALT